MVTISLAHLDYGKRQKGAKTAQLPLTPPRDLIAI
jgi:hypothetical protein